MKIFGTAFDRRSRAAQAANSNLETKNPKLSNRYEASLPSSPSRPYVPAFVRDARFDATSYARWEICRKVRYFFRNTWLLPRLQEEDVKYTVGSGLQIEAASSDSDFNNRLMDAYLDWCESPYRDSDRSMRGGHRLSWREAHMDGEVFENCTFLKLPGKAAQPIIELIESHRVSSPGQEYDYPQDGQNIIDGCQLGLDAFGNLIGKPTGFHIRAGVEGSEWKFRPAFDFQNPTAGGIIHVYDPERIGMYRAISPYAPIINETEDLTLLAALEMDRAKGNAELAAIFTTWNGEMPRGFQGAAAGVRSSGLPGEPTVPGGIDDKYIDEKIKQFRKVISARFIGMKPGEDVKFPENPSPSAAQQWLWKLTIHKICAARNIPMLLVLPDSIQGTVARAILDDAHLSFIAKFQIAARAARFKYLFFADWAIRNLPQLAKAPPDWRKCKVTPPRACNVDVGRTAAANALDIATGIKSYDDVTLPDGSTAKHRHQRKAVNIMEAQLAANEVNKNHGLPENPLQPVTLEQIIEPLASVAQTLAQAGLMDAQAEHGGEEPTPHTEGEEE